MSQLRIFDDTDGSAPITTVTDHTAIAAALEPIGVRFERWQANQAIAPDATQNAVIAAYRKDIDRLMEGAGYQSVDVISLTPEHPERASLRQKFLDEHTHSEDEVRFFVAGSGQFTLHVHARVYDILCQQGDLIGVPAGTRHWFDMSESPCFTAIRLFTNKDGWVADFTGDNVAERFPRMHASAASQMANPTS